ncbi:Ribokinase-like protein [Schizophyllum amplum]|uniref:Ribokinase-like protein n=1 Tax=Schizophyllum amplum TaxID=97359 RepID=A0A550CUN3_9AGAR|nr:Ribokinase-like protein [Auriculariopsis ampla]
MSDIVLLSLGTVLIDHFRYIDSKTNAIEREERHIGGGGLFAVAGARIWLPPSRVRIPVSGEDNQELRPELTKLCSDDEMWIWDREDTLEALIEYKGDERSFRYVNPRPPRMLSSVPQNIARSALCLHFCCTPEVLAQTLEQSTAPSQLVVYEPIPPSCTSANLNALRALLPRVHIFSPNHEEAEAFLSDVLPPERPSDLISLVELMAAKLSSFGARTVVIRSGSRGCYVLNAEPTLGALEGRWINAYWLPEEAAGKVQSTTGAGNSFLGGLCAGLHLAKMDIFKAAAYGSVSASFVVEQQGLPLSSMSNGKEKWNDDVPERRLRRLLP